MKMIHGLKSKVSRTSDKQVDGFTLSSHRVDLDEYVKIVLRRNEIEFQRSGLIISRWKYNLASH